MSERVSGIGEPEVLHEGRYLRLVQRSFPGGQWEYTERPGVSGVAAMVAVTDDGQVPLVRQFRVPLGCEVWELPAGLRDGDERGDETARRELVEECGLAARQCEWLMRSPACQASSALVLDFYLLEGLSEVPAEGGDEQFPLHRELVPLAEVEAFVLARMAEGELVDARIIAAVRLAQARIYARSPGMQEGRPSAE